MKSKLIGVRSISVLLALVGVCFFFFGAFPIAADLG